MFSCEKIKSQTSVNDDYSEINKRNKINSIDFEFKGFRWNTPKDEIIMNEGEPIDNKLMKSEYNINLPNTEEVFKYKNNLDDFYLNKKEIIEFFLFKIRIK